MAMKTNVFMLTVVCLLLPYVGMSQDSSKVPQKGSKVYVIGESKNEDAMKAIDRLIDELKDWAYWEVKPTKDEADFVLKADIKASKGMTLTSWGGTSYTLTAQIIAKGGNDLWESAQYKASPNGTNGFNAGNAVVKKFMRALKKKFK